jgi:hypothetical protein
MAFVTNTLENQSIVLKEWGRGNKTNNLKYYFPLHNVKIEELGGGTWSRLTFIDPFTLKEVSIKKARTSYTQLNKEDVSPFDRHGIKGFGGFSNKAKRAKKVKKPPVFQDPLLGMQAEDYGDDHIASRSAATKPGTPFTYATPIYWPTAVSKFYSYPPADRVATQLGEITTQLNANLDNYIGAPINQSTIAAVEHDATRMVKVFQDKIFKDRLNVDVAFTVPPPPQQLKFTVTDQEIKYENRDE